MMSTVETDLQKIRDNGLEHLYFVSYWDDDKCKRVTKNFLTKEEVEWCDLFSEHFIREIKVMDELTLNLRWISYKKRKSNHTLSDMDIGEDLIQMFGDEVFSNYRNKVLGEYFDEVKEVYSHIFPKTDDSKTKNVEDSVI